MKVFLSPQVVAHEDRFTYAFGEQTVTATYKDVIDTFDFTEMPFGELRSVTSTTLEVSPILAVRKNEEGLFVTLLNYIGENATQEEKFPEWEDV